MLQAALGVPMVQGPCSQKCLTVTLYFDIQILLRKLETQQPQWPRHEVCPHRQCSAEGDVTQIGKKIVYLDTMLYVQYSLYL